MKVKEKITIKTGSDFSGVGAFDYAIERVAKNKGFNHERVYACDWDKYARITYAHNHGEPTYYPEDVYEREIPKESLDIYMTSPPCQSFSLAGKREGKNSDKGVLFFNSHKFIQKNKPRFFIFENVKGLLSDDNGRTFQEWLNYLGGKSVNGLPMLFKDENAVDYHIYWKVLNSKKHGVPQNRERVFIIGIRDDQDNGFTFPKEEHLTLKLKDVLENEVDKKYFLSDKQINQLLINGINSTDSDLKCIGNTQPSGNGMNGNVYDYEGIAPTLSTNNGEGIKIKTNTKKGYETATENDSINFSVPSSKTRRGRVGKEVAQTLDTSCNQGVITEPINATYRHAFKGFKGYNDLSPTIKSSEGSGNQILLNNIRRLTPRECFRLQDFPDSFDFSVVSDTQAYKQAGNSITVRVLELILLKLKL
jgi:DNA (cytosine-5)-methyltransferase 1